MQAWSALVGNSISGMEDGKPLVEHYLADGTAKSMTGNEISTGKWALVGDTVCFKYDADTECYKIEVVGNTVTFTDAKGSGTRYDILKGNPKNLWPLLTTALSPPGAGGWPRRVRTDRAGGAAPRHAAKPDRDRG